MVKLAACEIGMCIELAGQGEKLGGVEVYVEHPGAPRCEQDCGNFGGGAAHVDFPETVGVLSQPGNVLRSVISTMPSKTITRRKAPASSRSEVVMVLFGFVCETSILYCPSGFDFGHGKVDKVVWR